MRNCLCLNQYLLQSIVYNLVYLKIDLLMYTVKNVLKILEISFLTTGNVPKYNKYTFKEFTIYVTI